MDVINKFCSTVSSTVSQLSGVLPGNPVTREFEINNHIASAGPGLLWKVYSGFKKSTKQPASIFVFEKKNLVPQDKELVVEMLKRGIAQLTKLRHPQILVVQHPLEESRDSLAFATEPVFASLANVLGKTTNTPNNGETFKDHSLHEVEIKYGLLQVTEGLAFLHKDAKILHHNLTPSNIIINQQGAWKIFGFDFAVQSSSPDGVPVWPYVDYGRKYDHELIQPDLGYLAPECGLSECQSAASDIYSLGVLIYAIYNKGQSLFFINDWKSYTSSMSQLKSLSNKKLSSIPEGLSHLTQMMLNFTPELRPDEHEFMKVSFFEDVGVKALNYLDSLFQWDNKQKAQFYKGLPQILDKLPHRVCLYRIIPCLTKEFVNPIMVPFVLPNVFAIAANSTKMEFVEHILPHLKPVMAMQDPIQILLIFMQKMDLLLKMTPCEEVKSDVLPLLYRALESDAQEIQELCLSVLPTFANLIEYPAMKNALLPRIKRLCLATNHISVRVNCLVCVGKLLDHLDKWLVLDEVLPFLPQIPSREPAVLMGILGIYKLVLTNKKMTLSKEVMAGKIIPFLMPLSIENSLTLNQFNAIMSVIKDMVSKVEAEHRVKLEQLQALKDDHKSFESQMAPPPSTTSNSVPVPDLDDLFGTKDTSKLLASNFNSKQTLPTTSNSGQLTFEEKQRIVLENDTARKLQMAGTITPTPVAPIMASAQVKDLTASLIGDNLMLSDSKGKGGTEWQVKSPASSVPQSTTWGQGGLPMGSPWGVSSPRPLNSTTGPLNSTTGPLNSTTGTLTSTTGPFNPTTGPLNSTTGPLNSTTGPFNPTTGPLNSTTGPLPNGASFHSRPTPPRVDWRWAAPPLLLPSSQQATPKPLSQSEINDFLS